MAASLTTRRASGAQGDLMSALSALHLGGKYSDLTITCNSRQWPVHKAIICSRSGFFDGACSHRFRESSTGVIDLSEDDEDAVEQMIHFFYHLNYLDEQPEQRPSALFRHRAYAGERRNGATKLDLSNVEDPLLAQVGYYSSNKRPLTPPTCSPGDALNTASQSPRSKCRSPSASEESGYSSEEDEDAEDDDQEEEEVDDSTESESHLILHAQVYALAEKYDVPSLKQLARRKFEMNAACYYDAPELAEAIQFVYSSTIDSDRGLRDIVMQLFRSHPRLANTQDIFAIIKQTPSLALDLWKLERGLL